MDPPTIVKTFKHNPSQQQPIFNTVLEQSSLHYRSFSQNKNSTLENDDDTEISIFDAQKYFCENNDPKLIKTQPQKIEPSSHETLPRLSSVSSSNGHGRNCRTRSFHSTPTASSEASWNSQTGLLVKSPGSIGVSLKNFSPDDDNSKKIIQRNSSVAKKWIFGRKCCCTGKKSVRVKEATTTSGSGHHLGPTIENKNNGKANNLYAKSDSHKAKPLSSKSQRSSISSDHHHHVMEIHQNKIVPQSPLVSSSPENNFPANCPTRQQLISATGRSFVDGAGGFSFPILKNPTQAVKPGPKGSISKGIISPLEEDPPRDSLEVFQPMDNPINARHRFNPGSPIGCVASTDDDLGSDASSDLFEIDSFSTQTTSYPMYRRRDSFDEAPTFNPRKFTSANGNNLNNNNSNNNIRRSLDEPPTPSVAATECYAPSEVSIDWSVTTAEGFDRASVSNLSVSASEIGSGVFSQQRMQEESGGGGDGGKRKGNGRGLLLISCRHEKAVSVGPQPVKCLPPSSATEGVGGQPVCAMHVGGRPPRVNKTTTPGNDHSGRLSLAFVA